MTLTYYLYKYQKTVTVFFMLLFLSSAEALTLSEGLQIVFEKSRTVAISRSDSRIAETDAAIAMSRLLPSVHAAAGWTGLRHEPSALFGGSAVPVSQRNFLSYSIVVQQTLYDFSGSASRYDAAKAALSAKKLEMQRVQNLSAIEFVLVYLELLEQEKMITLAEKEVEMIDSHRRNAQSFFKEGALTRNDLLQAEVKIADASQRLLTLQMLRSLQASRLNSLMLQPLNSALTIQDLGDQVPAAGYLPDVQSAWELAEKQRVELQMADAMLRALGFEDTAKRSEYLPRFFLKGGYDFTENRYQLYEGNWSVVLGLNLNLFNGGATSAELRKISLEKEKLITQREKLRDDIRLEVQQYLLQARTARDRLKVSKDAVLQAEENLRINRVRYEEGIGTGTDVLDAVTLLTLAATNRQKALYDMKKYEAAVFYALGRDLLEVYRQ